MHGLFGKCKASYGIVDIFRGRGDFVEFCCNSLWPAGVIDSAVGDGG